MSTSTWPQAVDNDANLLRVISSDTATTADHNNLVDAIESVELSLGATDNTMGSRVSPAFTAPVLHQVNIASIAGRNPRFPYSGPAGSDVVASTGAVGTGWAVDAACSIDFSVDAPYARLLCPPGTDKIALVGGVGAGPQYGVIFRTRTSGSNPGSFIEFGFIVPGDGGVDGVRLNGDGSLGMALNTNIIVGPNASPFRGLGAPWCMVGVFYDGTYMYAAVSTDGWIWDFLFGQPNMGVPTGVGIHMQENDGRPFYCWIDWIQSGSGLVTPYPY